MGPILMPKLTMIRPTERWLARVLDCNPNFSLSGGLSLDVPLNNSISFFLTPSVTYQSEMFFEQPNNPLIREDGYALVNVRGGFSFEDGRYEIVGFARNLFDEEFLIDAGNTGGAFGIPTFIRENRAFMACSWEPDSRTPEAFRQHRILYSNPVAQENGVEDREDERHPWQAEHQGDNCDFEDNNQIVGMRQKTIGSPLDSVKMGSRNDPGGPPAADAGKSPDAQDLCRDKGPPAPMVQPDEADQPTET